MALPRKTLTITRYTSGKRVNGIHVPGASSAIEITASTHILNNKNTSAYPEGLRLEGALRLITATELIGADNTDQIKPDEVSIDGENYEVFQCRKWDNLGTIDHYVAYVHRIIQQ